MLWLALIKKKKTCRASDAVRIKIWFQERRNYSEVGGGGELIGRALKKQYPKKGKLAGLNSLKYYVYAFAADWFTKTDAGNFMQLHP